MKRPAPLALAIPLLLSLAAPLPCRAEGDRYADAMRRLTEADASFRAGRLGDAMEGYLDLLREFPTWWLPTLKAGVVAKAQGLPAETVVGWVDRARGLSPTGSYLPLVEGLLAPGVPRDPARVEGAPRSPVPDPLADRMALLRAGRLSAQGRLAEAESEYRAVLSRTPAILVARWRLARLLEGTGRKAEAAALLREAGGRSAFPPRCRAEAARMERSDGLDTHGK